MGVQVELQDIQSGFLSAAAHTANNTLIEAALDKALDRTSNNNNTMQVALDMGNNAILNLPDTTDPSSPATYGQLTAAMLAAGGDTASTASIIHDDDGNDVILETFLDGVVESDDLSAASGSSLVGYNLTTVDLELDAINTRLLEIPTEVDAAGTADAAVDTHNNDAGAHPALSAFITAEANRAEAAADAAAAAGFIYPDVASGEAARSNGEYFWVVSSDNDEVLELWLMGAVNATDTGKRTPSAELQLAQEGLLSLFDVVTSNNIYDPATNGNTDDSVVTPSGATQSALARYMVSGFLPVTVSQTYMIDITNLPEEWEIYSESIQTYDSEVISAPTNIATLTPTVLESRRLLHVTIPAGSVYMVFNLRKLTGDAPDAAEFLQARELCMVYAGTTQLPYQAWAGPNTYTPDTTYFVTPEDLNKKLQAQVVGTSVYIRQPYNDTQDSIRRYIFNDTALYETGVVDFRGIGVIANTDIRDLDIAFSSSEKLYVGLDNAPPIRINNAFIGGGHGIPATKTLTKVGHGLTNTDVGDVGTDLAAKSWVLSSVVDADNITVTAANTGTATDWLISGVITGTTITFAGAGAFTFTAQAQGEFKPVAQNYTYSFVVDGEVVTDLSSKVSCDTFEIRESYGIPNAASFLSTLISEKGTSSPRVPSDPALQTQVGIDITWRMDKYGSCAMYYSHHNVQDYARGTDDYFGGMQRQTILKASRDLLQYIPDVSPVSGYDFKNKADITSNTLDLTVPVSACDDPTDPASHFAQIVANASVPEFGVVMGYKRDSGVGIPANRASLVTDIYGLSSSEKQYPRAVDRAVQPDGGEHRTVVCYDNYYDMSANPDFTCNNFIEFADGSVHWIFDCHKNLTNEWVDIPKDLIGRNIEVLNKSDSLTLHNEDVVMGGGFLLSVTGSYGNCVLKLTK